MSWESLAVISRPTRLRLLRGYLISVRLSSALDPPLLSPNYPPSALGVPDDRLPSRDSNHPPVLRLSVCILLLRLCGLRARVRVFVAQRPCGPPHRKFCFHCMRCLSQSGSLCLSVCSVCEKKDYGGHSWMRWACDASRHWLPNREKQITWTDGKVISCQQSKWQGCDGHKCWGRKKPELGCT